MKPDPIEQELDRYVAAGKIDPQLRNSVRRLLLARGKENLTQAVADVYRSQFGEDKHYGQFVERAKHFGYWFVTEESLQRAGESLTKIIENAGKRGTDYQVMLDTLANPHDADLYAAFVLNIPEVREEVKKNIGTYDQLYRVTRRVLKEKRRRSGEKKLKEDRQTGNKDHSPYNVCQIITEHLPDNHFEDLHQPQEPKSFQEKEEYEAKQRLFSILREKARRDCFQRFNLSNNPQEALSELELYVTQETNNNLRFLYEDQLKMFRNYFKFQQRVKELEYVNPNFINPSTQERGILPSFHQIVAMYHNLEEKRFGIFDDCGTGKTAIAALMKRLIEERKGEKGKFHGRTLVIGPKSSSKAWKDGLQGDEGKRYFEDAQTVEWINGHKDDQALERLRNADFIFVNYEQLILDFPVHGKNKKVYEVLIELGYDQVIVDEVQEAKNITNITKRGNITESMAVRLLTNNAGVEYVSLLSGTPMPDNLNDYANILFMLHPEYFLEEIEIDGEKRRKVNFSNIDDRFQQIYEGDPRALYALVRQNTIRRRSNEVTELPGTELIEDLVELTPIQRKIVDYVFDQGKKDWLTQIRYAVLDPRLVSPKILDELKLLGKVSRKDSAKYMRLEEMLTASDGPIAAGDKIAIFSSMFAEGVTREPTDLKIDYISLGISKEGGYTEQDLQHKILVEMFQNGEQLSVLDLERKLSLRIPRKEKVEFLKRFKAATAEIKEKGMIKRSSNGSISLSIYSKEAVGSYVEEFERLGIRTLREDLEEVLYQKFKRKVELQSIDADTRDDIRESAVDRLHNGLEGVICTTLSGGVSLNFSPVTHVYFLDEYYSPAVTEQAIARAARRGQKEKVYVHFLYGKDSIDIDVRSLLEQKKENIQMALDGIELLDTEKEILYGGRDPERLKELFLKRRGGLGIDLSQWEVESIDAFETRKVNKIRNKESGKIIVTEDMYEHTVAQEIREAIMRDPVGIWHEQSFVDKYIEHFESLGPFLLSRAKVVDIIKRAKNKEIQFPSLLLADAAGQGILYSAFQDLSDLVREHGFEVPVIIDRDFSKPMHEASPNTHKYLADMCGKPRVFGTKFLDEFGHFDFVDNSSLTLLENKGRMRDYVLEANRILNVGGYLQLGVGGWYFASEFFEGMKEAGFETLVKSVRHNVAKPLVKALKERFGPHYAEAYRSKLEATTFSLFQKVDEKKKADEKYFLLENPASEEEKKVQVSVPKKEVEKTTKKDNEKVVAVGRTAKGIGKRYSGKLKLKRDPHTGTVTVAKDDKE